MIRKYYCIASQLYLLSLPLIFTLTIAGQTAQAQTPDLSEVQVTRMLNRPIIAPGIHPSVGANIQGPTLVKVPEWLANPLGNYYLYFADHKGAYIRLAYADALTGPWQIYEPGTLQLAQSHFLTEPPEISEERVLEMEAERRASGVQYAHDMRTELTSTHIASPDVHIDNVNRRFIMYYHGLAGAGRQHSRVATSSDGIHFEAQPQDLGRTYMRAFQHDGMTYAMSMPGQFYRSRDGFTDFETGPLLFEPNMRHAGLLKRGNVLYVFWTRVGEIQESIMVSTIDLSGDWQQWRNVGEHIVLRPEFDWEGANVPMAPSMRSTAYGVVNQLRDPAIYEEGEDIYLLYVVGGESGIALAKIELGEGN